MAAMAFLCSSLEPGADGVGDYTRRLAGEFIRRGHRASVIALHDRPDDASEPVQLDEGVPVPVLRLPRDWPWTARVAKAREQIAAANPDWVSLQYVPFGYDRRGLAWRLDQYLQTIVQRRRLHLMLHEIWIQPAAGGRFRLRLLESLQRRLIQRLVRRLNPVVVETSNRQYVDQLARAGIRAQVRPVFSNIPRHPPSGWTDRQLSDLGVTPRTRREWLFLGVFGEIHPEWSLREWGPALLETAVQRARRPMLLGIGKSTPMGLKHFHAEANAARVPCRHLGIQGVEAVSDFLQTIDGGISTVPRTLLGKSGSAAAMVEHGVPLLVTRSGENDPVAESYIRESTATFVDAACATRLTTSRINLLEDCVAALGRELGMYEPAALGAAKTAGCESC